ncbi:hypothetical protein E2320_004372, partial [Naja naja]
VAADPSTPPASLTVATVSPPRVTSHRVTTLDLTSALGGPTSKPETLPASATSPVVAEPPKAPTTGTLVKTTAPSSATKPGDTATPAVVVTASTTDLRAPTLAPALLTTHPTSSRGIAAKDLASTSGPTKSTSPCFRFSLNSEKPGPPSFLQRLRRAWDGQWPYNLSNYHDCKIGTTSKDKFLLSPPCPTRW